MRTGGRLASQIPLSNNHKVNYCIGNIIVFTGNYKGMNQQEKVYLAVYCTGMVQGKGVEREQKVRGLYGR